MQQNRVDIVLGSRLNGKLEENSMATINLLGNIQKDKQEHN